MARSFDMSQLRNGLRVSAREDFPVWVRLFLGLIPALVAFLFARAFIGNWSWALAACVAVVALATSRGSQARLDITNVEFVTTGNIGRHGSRRTQVVSTGDVLGLEFRDFGYQRSGLYALTKGSAQCILPLVNYAEAMEVIRAVQTRFPGLTEHWPIETGTSEHILTLGLRKSK